MIFANALVAAFFSGLTSESVKSIASMAMFDDSQVAREDGLDLLTELSKADLGVCNIVLALMLLTV